MKEKVKIIGIIIGVLFLLIMFFLFNQGISGDATRENPKGGEGYCGAIENSDCDEEIALEICMTLYGNNKVNESDAQGCFDVWLRNNSKNNFNKLKKCAEDYRSGERSIEEYRECLDVWNLDEIELPIVTPEIEEIKNPFLGYYFEGDKKDKVEIFGEEKLFVYYPYEKYWNEESGDIFSGKFFNEEKSQWCNESKCGFLPEDFEIDTGYSFKRGEIGRINLFGTKEGRNKIMIYNGAEWFDRSEDIFTGGKGKLPKNFEVKFGFHNVYEDEIWVFGEGKWYINDFEEGWEEKTDEIKSNLPENKIPKVAYYFPSEKGGRIHLFYENKFYIYNPNPDTWTDLTDILKNIGLPQRAPDVGYYDKYNGKIVLFYGKNIYSLIPGEENVFSKDTDYLKDFEGLENLPSNEEINEEINYDYWDFYSERNTRNSDWKACENKSKRFVCFYNEGEGYSNCKHNIENNLENYMEKEICLNSGEKSLGVLKGNVGWRINSLSEIKQESYPHESIEEISDFRKGGIMLGDTNKNEELDIMDSKEIKRVVNQGKVVEDCVYDTNLDNVLDYKDYELVEVLVETGQHINFRCSESDKVLVGIIDNLKGIKICEDSNEKNCVA